MRAAAVVAAAAIVLGAVALLCASAHADDAAAARFHDERAREHYQRGQFEEAIREFFLEHRIAPNPRILFNIALCFQLLDREAEAFQMYTEYLASEDDDEKRRAEARAAVDRLEPRVARLRVRTEPPGARIFVDHREHGTYGRSPAVVAVAPGEHHVMVQLTEHRPAETTVSADRGGEVEVELALEAITGELVVESSVPGRAQVRTPGGEVAGEGATPLSVSLPPGPFRVSVSAEGYETHRGLVDVRADAVTKHQAVLEALPPPVGSLTVTANRGGALVTVDGTPAGFTPLALEALPVGARSVAVEREGLDPWQGEVEIDEEEPTWLTLTLEEQEPDTVHSPATWLLGATGLGALAAGGVTGIFALRTHADYEDALTGGDRDAQALRDRGRRLNVVTDTLLVVGGAAFAAAAVLYVVEGLRESEPSRASVTRGEDVVEMEK